MSEEKEKGFGTLSLHAGQEPDPATGARAVPIYQTTSYNFKSTEHAANLFALSEPGNIYTRIMNPTADVLEKRLAALDGGVAALAVASGQAAITVAVLNLTDAGQNFVASKSLYGGTHTLFSHTLKRLGIEVRFVGPADLDAVKGAIDDGTRLLYAESIGNPKNDVVDFEAWADIAHAAKIPFIVDNTVTTPWLLRPFDFGADIAVYSLTKFIGGHGTSIGGAIVDGGKFDWSAGDYPELTTPDDSYHGLTFTDAFGPAAFIARARVSLLRDLGPCMSPFNAFLFLQGLETLGPRMERHVANAAEIAGWLENHAGVTWVNYPGLPSHPSHELARKYMPRGAGAIIGFGIEGGHDAAVKFIESVELCSHLANIGDAKTLVIHPASTTHQQLTRQQQEEAGVSEDYIRLSVGIEDAADIKADLDQAVRKATQSKK